MFYIPDSNHNSNNRSNREAAIRTGRIGRHMHRCTTAAARPIERMHPFINRKNKTNSNFKNHTIQRKSNNTKPHVDMVIVIECNWKNSRIGKTAIQICEKTKKNKNQKNTKITGIQIYIYFFFCIYKYIQYVQIEYSIMRITFYNFNIVWNSIWIHITTTSISPKKL